MESSSTTTLVPEPSDNDKQQSPSSSTMGGGVKATISSISPKSPGKSSSRSSNKVRVVARIRPLNAKERSQQGEQSTLRKIQGKTDLIQVCTTTTATTSSSTNDAASKKKWYELDAVLEGTASQGDVYAQSGAQHAVSHDLMRGVNCSILAYGQTGAGKTFTMGTAAADTIDESAGIIPRATADLFASIHQKCRQATVTLSYLELYNEQVRDLFAVETSTRKSSGDRESNKHYHSKLKIREAPDGTVQVQGAVEKQVRSPAEIGALMARAGERRVVAATAMNATSSRSHAICTIRIQGTLKSSYCGGKDENAPEQADGAKTFSSKLTLVDLAGSERIKKTGAQGARQTEGININKSLLVLGQVVSALATPSASRKPPYRDSKLTRLLQDCLGGNSRTILLACVSPAASNVEETMNTLRYASNARRITNNVKANLASSGANRISSEQFNALKRDNARLAQENADLQAQLVSLQKQLRDNVQPSIQRTESLEQTASTSPLSDDENDSQSSSAQVPQQINCSSSEGGASISSHAHATTREASGKRAKDAPEGEPENVVIPVTYKQKTEAEYIRDISGYKLELAQLKERLDFFELLEAQNEDLQRELAESKAEAETAHMAASYLSDIVDELRDIKESEIERRRLKLQMMNKEQSWISFLQGMLENFRVNAARLSTTFDDTVVRKIEALNFHDEKPSQTLSVPSSASSSVSTDSCVSHASLLTCDDEDSLLDKASSDKTPSQEDLLRMAVEKPAPLRPFFSRQLSVRAPRNFSSLALWRSPTNAASKTVPWKECTVKFHQEILRVARIIEAEAESIQSISTYLAKECQALEKEIGERESETESLFASSKGADRSELVDHLSAMLLQRQIPLQSN